MSDRGSRTVFHDPKNIRWRWVRGLLLVLGAVTSLALGLAAASVLISPVLPTIGLQSPRVLPSSKHLLPPPRRPWAMTGTERAFLRAKFLLSEARKPGRAKAGLPPRTAHAHQMLGFYVNWDDTSLTSLKANLNALDGFIAEWLHVKSAQGDIAVDDEPKVDQVLATVRPLRPRMPIVALVNNFRGPELGWDREVLVGMLRSPKARQAAIASIVQFVQAKKLQGVNVDFENLPASGMKDLVTFVTELCAVCHPLGLTVSESIPADDPDWPCKALGHVADALIVMAYDEHWGASGAGPVASQPWFGQCVRARAAEVGSGKLIVALGNYGYDWMEKSSKVNALSFQEAVKTAEESEGKIALDAVALNPVYDYYDERDQLHHVWFLDAVTTFNQLVDCRTAGVRGYALWRLGSEDPSVWTVFGRRRNLDRETAMALSSLHYGYDLDYEGKGEVLRVAATPSVGKRDLTFDEARGLITEERLVSYPSPFVIERWGGSDPRKIALTFDDGPDPDYTPRILDVLERLKVHATFFVVGVQADRYSGILKRMVAEGHDVGNHTFSHPNIAAISERQLVLECNAMQRLLESRVHRGTVLFRPPYAEDVEPATPDEVRPLMITSRLGYYTIGMLIDPGDWLQPGVDEIVKATVEKALAKEGNVVLLHDGGGEREQTVAALPRLIEALRARGFQPVAVSELLGLPRDEVMPPVPKSERVLMDADDVVFVVIGGSISLLYLLFMAGIVLGCARLLLIGVLAIVQRWRERGISFPDNEHPPVSVVVPAFNEEKVVCETVAALLASDYPDFEVIVVDDGSKDGTLARLTESFSAEPRVKILTKANEGKAVALNTGIAEARGEIVVALDADTLFQPDTLRLLIRRFSDPRVGAVAGNAKVGNRINLHTCYQALEYITSQNMDRRAMDVLNCITVVPGSVGAWRKKLLLGAGGFTSATLAEDADLTLSILENGYKVAYEDKAIAFTEAPDTVRDFLKQRFRWMFGTLQAAWKHRRVLLRPKYGALGLFALPNVFLFQVIFPLISPVLDLFLVTSLITAVVQERFHPSSDVGHGFLHVLFYYAVFMMVDWTASFLAFVLEGDEEWRLLLWLPLQRFIYRQLMYVVAIRAVVTAVKGRHVGWGKLERKATVGRQG